MKERKNVFAKETVTVCDKCSGHMMYKGGGCYVCESCGEEYLTDFGKVKRFINTYGPSNAITISGHSAGPNTAPKLCQTKTAKSAGMH